MNLAKELASRIQGDVYTDTDTLTRYSTDASLFEIRPQLVIAPKDADDLRELVLFATEHEGVSLTARSGATGMDGGALSESIVLDFTKYFANISGVGTLPTGPHPGYAITQPGVYYKDFEKETLKEGMLMPTYPASREICTVGGMAANNSAGEKTLRYGKTADYVRRLKVVLSDGNEYALEPLSMSELEAKKSQNDFEGQLYRDIFDLIESNYELIQNARPNVSKNSAGYALWDVWDKDEGVFDLTQLFVGSQGTLGLITEITYDLIKPEPHQQMMVLFLDDMKDLGEMVGTVLEHEPTTFESYDDKTLKLALKFFFAFIKRLGFKNIFTLAINGIPEAFSILRYGIPKLVLQITFEGDDPEKLQVKAEKLQEDLRQYHPRYMEVVRSPKEAEEYWLIRRESFNLLRHKVKGMKTAPFIDDIVVRPEVLPEFMPKLNAILQKYSDHMIHNIAGHIGNGNFHIIPLMDLSQKASRDIIPTAAKEVYDLVLEYGGSITGEHNDGIIRTPFLEQQYGKDVYALFEEVKKVFDPKNIFNPGKKVGGTMDYAMQKVKTHN